MVHNVIATTFHQLERVCYQCSCELECSLCELLESNPWKLSLEQLRGLRDDLAREQMLGASHETGAAVCPHCDLLVECGPCRLTAPLDSEVVEELARLRLSARRSAA